MSLRKIHGGIFSAPEYQWKESLSIYPDAESTWVENTTKDVAFTYTLYDFNGKKIISEKLNKGGKQSIHINDLSTGVYILNIKEGSNSINKHLIIK